jgi:hypothetical protein
MFESAKTRKTEEDATKREKEDNRKKERKEKEEEKQKEKERALKLDANAVSINIAGRHWSTRVDRR